jgi:hypothetical protein
LNQGLGLFAAASVILLGAATTLVLMLRRILAGDLVPPPLIRREDAERAIAEVKQQADARVSDAQARESEHRGRADKAEEREEKWRDAWTVSESGRALAEAHVAGLTRAMAPVAQVLTSDAATAGLGMPPEPRA